MCKLAKVENSVYHFTRRGEALPMPPEWMRKIFALCIHETTLYILGIQLAVMMGPLTAPQLLGIIVKYVWIIFHLSIPANGRIWQYITYANKCISADWHVVILWSFRILWERGLNAILTSVILLFWQQYKFLIDRNNSQRNTNTCLY